MIEFIPEMIAALQPLFAPSDQTVSPCFRFDNRRGQAQEKQIRVLPFRHKTADILVRGRVAERIIKQLR